MTEASANEVVRSSANRLYWNSADTVDEIAERLGISRSAIYSALRPAPADADCPHCGAGLAFANRSARAAGRAKCPECGRTTLVGESSHPFDRATQASAQQDAPPAPRPRRAPPPPRVPVAGLPARDELRTALASVEPHRVLLVGGAALLGVALGTAAVRALRRWG